MVKFGPMPRVVGVLLFVIARLTTLLSDAFSCARILF